MNRVIIIMAKVPRTGNVKTRLQPILDAERRRALAEAFLSDAINKTSKLCDTLILAYAPAGESDYFDRFGLENLMLIEQRGTDLGEKMSSAFDFAFADLTEANVLMIGTDSPTFPADYIEEAFTALEDDADIVLGEAADGGFYLIGLKKNHNQLFKNIEWSTAAVYGQISRHIAELKLKLHNIPAWYDIDTPEDLELLWREMLAYEKLQKSAPQTYNWLLANQEFFDC